MAFTNSWDETTPTGSDNASTTDDFFRKHRLDLGERLEAMFMGFNAASNSAPENNIGVKFLKFYKQSSDPSADTDFGHLYVKLVDGIPELFLQDDENTTLQLTSGGDLKSSAGLVVDGNTTLTGTTDMTGNATMAGTLDIGSSTAIAGVLDEDDMATDSDTNLATQQSIKAYADTKEATLVTQATASIFGSRTFKDSGGSNNLNHTFIYRAGSDGFLTVSLNGQFAEFVIRTDSSSSPSTVVAATESNSNQVNGVTVPILKDDYVKVTRVVGNRDALMSWVPVGTGGLVKQ